MRRTALILAALTLPALGLAVGGCATIASTVGSSWNTALVGQQEVPGPGSPSATGTARVTADATTNTICADLTTAGLANPTMAHIHKGARGASGPPILTLETPVNGASSKCYSVEKALAASLIADPANFYVNIHTAAYPSGAIRGQLGRM